MFCTVYGIMRAWLLRLRRDGVSLGDPRPAADWIEGFVSSEQRQTRSRTVLCLVFRRVGDANMLPNTAELFDPHILSVRHGTIYLRGHERVPQGKATAAVVQEWRLDCQRAVPPDALYGPPMGELAPCVRDANLPDDAA
jgi:hypothetical protein